ncbi:hypothetical protein [Phenylobacterium sp.]|jgi:hypothetical protein|uniref:hypothetical protein n=1 Tax=Phenylobacterium sp. TaxID=1871053 RepID=UPI0012018633|nr:hypothetical protein [Phenylobacterium sp.]THD51696.1 MAG: hypothetical protein E8A12_20695 [Phenylobacterium sp.]
MRGLAILGAGLLCAGCGQVADAQAKLIDSVRIHDAVAGYEKASQPVDRCVKAKSVVIAYTDARDTAETAAWSAREHEDCQAALIALRARAPAKP